MCRCAGSVLRAIDDGLSSIAISRKEVPSHVTGGRRAVPLAC